MMEHDSNFPDLSEGNLPESETQSQPATNRKSWTSPKVEQLDISATAAGFGSNNDGDGFSYS